MERTKWNEGDKPDTSQTIKIAKAVFDVLLKQDNNRDVISLYNFYLYTSVWQKTDQVKATNDYCIKALGFGKSTFYKAKKILADLGLIEQIEVGRTKSSFGQYYIKVNRTYTNDRYHQIDRPVKNKGKEDRKASEHIEKSPVSSKPIDSNDESNAFLKHKILEKHKKNSTDDSGDGRNHHHSSSKKDECPYGATFGNINMERDNCAFCEDKNQILYNKCRKRENELMKEKEDIRSGLIPDEAERDRLIRRTWAANFIIGEKIKSKSSKK
jgi:hypothetical protein